MRAIWFFVLIFLLLFIFYKYDYIQKQFTSVSSKIKVQRSECEEEIKSMVEIVNLKLPDGAKFEVIETKFFENNDEALQYAQARVKGWNADSTLEDITDNTTLYLLKTSSQYEASIYVAVCKNGKLSEHTLASI